VVVDGTGVSVGGTSVAVAVDGADVGVAVGSAFAPPHPANKSTSAKLNINCHSFLLFIVLFLVSAQTSIILRRLV
jgi:hypothetical protein